MEQLPGEDHCEQKCRLRRLQKIVTPEKMELLLCRHQAIVSPGSSYIFSAFWRRNWKSETSQQQPIVSAVCVWVALASRTVLAYVVHKQHLTRLTAFQPWSTIVPKHLRPFACYT